MAPTMSKDRYVHTSGLNPHTCSQVLGPITFQDGIAGAISDDSRYIITSPNVDFVPQVNLGTVTVAHCKDQRFGMEDPIQWPQVFSTVFQHFPLILRRPLNPHDPLAIMWWDMGRGDFVQDPSIPVDFLGTVDRSRINQLRPFVVDIEKQTSGLSQNPRFKCSRISFTAQALRDAFDRLSYPATLRDLTRQVVQVQRFYLESLAWLTFYVDMKGRFSPPDDPQPFHHGVRFVGAYTTHPEVVQRLFRAGIPVWFLRFPHQISRSTVIEAVVSITRPTSIDISDPTFPVYHGSGGDAALAVTCMGGHSYADVERFPWNDVTEAQALTNAKKRAAPAASSSSAAAVCSEAPSQSLVHRTAAQNRRLESRRYLHPWQKKSVLKSF